MKNQGSASRDIIMVIIVNIYICLTCIFVFEHTFLSQNLTESIIASNYNFILIYTTYFTTYVIYNKIGSI